MKSKVFSLIALIIVVLVTIQSTSAQDDLLFKKRIASSTWNSFLYGDALVVIGEIDGAAIIGIPVISAGVGALVPLLVNEKWPVSTNQLMLTNHGQSIGWVHGGALSMLAFGDELFESNDNYKVAVGLGAASSIGLGLLGRSLGKNKDWSEGQVALYRHYGWFAPLTASCLSLTFSEDFRVMGGAVLLGGAAGYFAADRVNNWHQFTRGDVRATQPMTVLTGTLGYCVMLDIIGNSSEYNRAEWLIPAAGLVAGTAVGHLWLKDANLTARQGMTTIWAASGGALLGFGITMLTSSEDFTLWYTIPYATSMGAYAFAVESLKKKNSSMAYHNDPEKSRWNFSFMPYNLVLNNKLADHGYMMNGRTVGMQPLFAASVTF